jgi:DNA-binding CsgD family transcriptional regulator
MSLNAISLDMGFGAASAQGCGMIKGTGRTHPPTKKRRVGVARSRSPILQGREQDIALINDLIDRIDQGGSTLVISGEPGIGKSALLEVARHRANDRGISVLSMTGVLAEVHLPYAALEQALRPLMKRAAGLVPRQRSALRAAFGMEDDAGAPDIFLVALATLTLLTEGATRKPILLVADDAQWLDQATFDALAFISRRLGSDPVVLLLAMRDGFNRSFGDTSTLRLRLSGLDDTDAGRLIDAHAPGLSADLRSRFIKEAVGNPLALVELPRGDRAADTQDAQWLPLTERLERAFSSRLSDLPDAVRTLLFVAAENDGTSLHEILRSGEALLGEPVGVDTLAPAITAKLIEVERTEVRFRHPLVRSAMHQAADPALRQKIHAALAAAIQGQLDRQLWHRAAATIGPDDELASEHDRMAMRALRRGAVAMAIEVLENAARLSSTAIARSDRLLRAAELAADLGQPELLERLLCQVDTEESGELAAVRIGWCREISQPPAIDDPAKVPALIGFAAQASAAGAKDLASNLLWRAGQRCWWSNASDELRTRVLVAAKRLELPETDPRLIAIYAYVEPLRSGGEVRTRLQALFEAGNVDLADVRILGSTANVIGAFDLGAGFLAESSAALRAQGRLGDLARALFAQGWAEMEVGDWTGAMREAEESVRFAEETDGPLWVAAATILKAKLTGMQGNLETSEAHAAQAERLVLSIGATFLRVLLQVARGISAIGAGQHWQAYEYLRRVFAPADPAFTSGLEFFALADFVEAAVFSGNADSARGVIDEVERVSAPTPVPWVETMLHYGKALLAAPEDAEQFFVQGLGPAAKRWPFLRGRLLLAYGGWLRRQRRPAEARAPLREARDIFDALGASPWSDRAREELRASGESSRRRAEFAWETLSPQELHIAQLAADGLSNKEIGARLYLSHRTVGYHLHRIFSKTGITSRSGLHPILVGAGHPAA